MFRTIIAVGGFHVGAFFALVWDAISVLDRKVEFETLSLCVSTIFFLYFSFWLIFIKVMPKEKSEVVDCLLAAISLTAGWTIYWIF